MKNYLNNTVLTIYEVSLPRMYFSIYTYNNGLLRCVRVSYLPISIFNLCKRVVDA